METVTFDQLGEVPDEQVDTLIALLTGAMSTSAAPSPRVAQVFAAMREVLQGEQQRRAGRLPHSAPPVTVALPTAGELSDDEMRDLMRWALEHRTDAAGGMPAVASFFDTVLRALDGTRTHQRDTLERMDHDLR